jgi:hypothetical protein
MSYNPASTYDKSKGFAKPEWPVIDESITSPVTTLWEQDPATLRHDCCIARKIRPDRDLRFDVSVSLHWQCGKPNAPASNVCADCGANKIKFETVKQCHPSWQGIMTEAPPKHTEVFYKGVYRFIHPKKVTPVFKHTARVIEKRTKLTDEEKAARAAAKDGPKKITAKALDNAIGLMLLEQYRASVAMHKGDKKPIAAVTLEKYEAKARQEWDEKEAARIAKKESSEAGSVASAEKEED